MPWLYFLLMHILSALVMKIIMKYIRENIRWLHPCTRNSALQGAVSPAPRKAVFVERGPCSREAETRAPPQRLLAGRPSSEMETLGVQSREIVLLKKNT